MGTGLLLLALFAIAFAMIAKRLSTTVVTAPMGFIAFGFLVSQFNLIPPSDAESILHILAEVALILLLFLDAAQINLAELRRRHVWPQRMLLIGLPLSIAIGTVVAWAAMPAWPLAVAALVAAILAPTDAALGQAVVTNSAVPERARRSMIVESGLNDGLALPAVLFFASLSAMTIGSTATDWLAFTAQQLILGPAVGAAVGTAGGFVLLYAKRRDLTAEVFEGVGAISLACASYLAADQVGGNGFIAAFVAGLCFGNVVKGQCKFIYEFTESEGLLLTWGAFFLLGLALVPEALHHLSWPVLLIILSSLLIVRPLAIWISLIGTDASPTTRLFFGWFGPRGLATALFALVVVTEIDPELADPVLMLAVNAVWISAFLHGLSANPGAKFYAARIRNTDAISGSDTSVDEPS